MTFLDLVRLPPEPRRFREVHDPEIVAHTRHLDCRQYDFCLEMACASNWSGFTCRDCAAYAPKSQLELQAEAEAIRAALRARQLG